jgi:hypothetical protein
MGNPFPIDNTQPNQPHVLRHREYYNDPKPQAKSHKTETTRKLRTPSSEHPNLNPKNMNLSNQDPRHTSTEYKLQWKPNLQPVPTELQPQQPTPSPSHSDDQTSEHRLCPVLVVTTDTPAKQENEKPSPDWSIHTVTQRTPTNQKKHSE